MWRRDPQRSGLSPEELPTELHLLWSRDLPTPAPAWSDSRLGFDLAPQPVVVGKTLLLADTRTGSLLALDTDTGAECWRFWANGPVRLAPAVGNGRVYVVADDGFLFCLSLADGSLLWRFFGGLGESKLLANGQLSSMWPARGGPVVADGRVYFGAGVWPFMGTPIYALDAKTGREIWTNDRNGVLHANRPYHQYKAYWGTSPQGSLALDGDTLIIPSGRSQPLVLDAASGAITRAEAGWKDYGGGGDARVAVAGKLLLAGGYVFGRDGMLPLCLNEAAKGIKPFTCLPVCDGRFLYAATAKGIEGHDLSEATFGTYTGNYGVRLVRCDTKTLWQMPEKTKPTAMIMAGNQLYVALPKRVLALTPKPGEATPEITWQTEMGGTPSELAAADGKLFVTTREGRVLCFGGAADESRNWPRELAELAPAPKWEATAQRLLALPGANEGYCIVLGLTDGGLVTELLRQSDLRLIAIDENPATVQALRQKLAAADLLGSRASVHTGDPATFGLPQYLANLVVSEKTVVPQQTVQAALPALRPYGGIALLPLPRQADLMQLLGTHRDEFSIGFAPDAALIHRTDGPTGAANWEHEAAGPGNTWMSRDRAVRAPLGVLWFGGPAEAAKLYRSRHSDPCTARVVDGRLFIYGNGTVTAADAYTGRLLWSRRLPKRKPYQNRRSYTTAGPFPGPTGDTPATAWYVAKPNAIYVSYGQACEVWDPTTGKTLHTFTLDSPDERKLYWGDLRVWEDVLIAGAEFPTKDVESAFITTDLEGLAPTDLATLCAALKAWQPLAKAGKRPEDTDLAFAQRCLNLLLSRTDLETMVPPALLDPQRSDPEQAKAITKARAAVKHHLHLAKYEFRPFKTVESVNRRLLEACHPSVRRNPDKEYWYNLYPWDGTFTKQLVGLDRKQGNVLWRQVATYGFPQKSLAVGNGKVFCIDRVEIDRDQFLARRGTPQTSQPAIRAFDARSGKQLWTANRDVVGYQLMYCPDQDVLIQPSAYDPDPASWSRKKRQQWVRLIAYRGSDGKMLWDSKLNLERGSGRHRMWWNWFVHKNTVLVESYSDSHADFYGFDLLTGKRKVRQNTVTDTETAWGFRRRGGCTKNLSCENLVLFRSSTAGYYDAAGDTGTVNLAGFRNGCKNSLIPAAGILNAPNYASGCTCNYPVFTALALVHAPSVESWASSTYSWDGARVKRVGINLGAPGDQRAANGTLWLDYPSVGGTSPDIPIDTIPADLQWFYHHSARMQGGPLPRVTASGAEGLTKLAVTLRKIGTAQPAGYTVRLFFAEYDDRNPGDRVFGVALQGKRVIEKLDIRKEADHRTGLVKEFRSISADDLLTVELIPITGKPTLCGIEIVLE